MSENRPDLANGWTDPDDAPEFSDAMFDRAEFAVGGQVVRKTKRAMPAVDLSRYRAVPRAVAGGVHAMAAGKKTTSPKAAKSASKVLKDGRSGQHSKTAAGSALSQREKGGKKK